MQSRAPTEADAPQVITGVDRSHNPPGSRACIVVARSFRAAPGRYNGYPGKWICRVTAVPFGGYRESFSPETLAVLEAAFNAAWDAVVASGVDCDQQATANCSG